MTALSLSARRRVHAPVHEIWRALTEPEALSEWYAPGCRWEIEGLGSGSLVRFFNTATDVQTAVVEHADPPRLLVLRWRYDVDGAPVSLLNAFALTPAGDETEVIVRQEGYESLPTSMRAQWLEQDQGAVDAIASALEAYVER